MKKKKWQVYKKYVKDKTIAIQIDFEAWELHIEIFKWIIVYDDPSLPF